MCCYRPNHNQTAHSAADIYKPSRSPLSTSRYTFPPTAQLQSGPPPTNISQVQVSQRYPSQGTATITTPPLHTGVYRDYRQRISLLQSEYGPSRTRDSMQSGVVCVDSLQGQQPLKKIRLQDKEGVQPLRIDTRVQ